MNRIVLLLFLLISDAALAFENKPVYPEVTIAGSQLRNMHSKSIDDEFELWIKTPNSYDKTDKNYPVVYVLDAQWTFTLMVSLYGQLQADGDMPEVILVGVTWADEAPNYDVRIRDLLPFFDDPKTGKNGADKFMQFFEEQLFPYVNDEFRTTEQRYLIGGSFGGWFTLYSLFQRPELFSAYLAVAPTVALENNMLLSFTDGFREKVKSTNTNLYMTVGGRDPNKEGFDTMVNFLTEGKFEGLDYHYETFEKLAHSGIGADGINSGLQHLFKRRTTKLNQKEKTSLVGKFRNEESNEVIEIRLKENQLHFSHPDDYELALTAESKTDFYWREYRFNLSFEGVQNPQSLVAGFSNDLKKYTRVE